MLVLSRKPSESLLIDSTIEVKVISVSSNGRVKLGISAPDHIRIVRSELIDRAVDTAVIREESWLQEAVNP